MGKVYAFVLGMVVGFGMYHLANGHHLVRASDGWHLIAKTSPTLAETYVDIRNFSPADWLEHPALVAAITASGNEQLMSGAVETAVGQGIEQGIDLLKPAADPAPPSS